VAAAIGVGELGSAQLGGFHTCATATSGGGTFCWGNSDDGQVNIVGWPGRHGVARTRLPLPFAMLVPPYIVQQLAPPLMVAAGAYHVCVLASDGVLCWGHNGDGEGATGNFDAASGFTPISGPISGTAGAYHLAAGGFHTCAVLGNTPTGTVAYWGNGLSNTRVSRRR
jgi:hypothetical protein